MKLYLLWLILGTVGLHRMVLGRPVSGTFQMLLGLASWTLWLISFSTLAILNAVFGESQGLPSAVLAAVLFMLPTLTWWLIDGLLLTRMVRQHNRKTQNARRRKSRR